MEETKLDLEDLKSKYVKLSSDLFDKRKKLIELVQVMTAKDGEFAQSVSSLRMEIDVLGKETQAMYQELSELEMIAGGVSFNKVVSEEKKD